MAVFIPKAYTIFSKQQLSEFLFFFGDQYTKNPEADELIARNGGKSFEDEFFAAPYLLALLNNDASLQKMGDNAMQFIESQPIASQIIVDQIAQKQLS